MRCGEIELDAGAVTVRSLASADSVILVARHSHHRTRPALADSL